MQFRNRAATAGATVDMPGDNSVAMGAESLAELRAGIGDCQRCKLCSGRTHIVFGVGNPHAKLMFVGEGPGHEEDLQGEPFVGRAGQLLTDIITKGMGLKREDVYICNVVKCRPPQNRNPEPDEVAACEPFLKKQIDIVQPQIIVGSGKIRCADATAIARRRSANCAALGPATTVSSSCRRSIRLTCCATRRTRSWCGTILNW